MKYMGSKNRLTKYILPIMLSDRKQNQWWVEPFVGGGNVIDKIDGNRLGADINKYLIKALVDIRDNIDKLPKNKNEFTEHMYNQLKREDCEYAYKGYAGFAFSYSGKWLGGWCRDGENKRDYVKESYNNAIKQSPKLQGVKFVCSNYVDLNIPDNSIIYCDPPYKNTTSYSNKFDHGLFFEWCVQKAKEGHTVYVSEYTAPNDKFECLWEKEMFSSLTKNTGSKKSTEKLFKVKG